MLVSWRDGIGLRPSYNPEILIFISLTANQRHVIGTGVMVFIRQSVCIIKMSVSTAKSFHFIVHHINEGAVISPLFPANILCDLIGTFVGRGKHNSIQALLYGHLLAYISPDVGGITLILVYSIL